MKIVTVEYRRLRSFGRFENETIGACAEIDGETPEQALAELREWVDGQMGDEEQARALRVDIRELQWKKESLERQFETAGRRWEAVLAFMDKLGIQRPSDIPETLEGLPF